MTNDEEDAAELAGLRAQVYTLRREVDQLRLGHIALVEENRSLWALIDQADAP